MATKQRYQNPTIGDTVQLRLFTYNANNRANLYAIEGVNIFCLDPEKRLIQRIEGDQIDVVDEGEYLVNVDITKPTYVLGHYIDEWEVLYEEFGDMGRIENRWQVYPPLWYSTPTPIAYDFAFDFRPNRMREGEKRYLNIDILPNVPRGSDLEQYYANLAIANPVQISIEMECVPCMPPEHDLRLIVDADPVTMLEKGHANYFLDTEDLDMKKGIYNIWFQMFMGESRYLSDKQQFQIF